MNTSNLGAKMNICTSRVVFCMRKEVHRRDEKVKGRLFILVGNKNIIEICLLQSKQIFSLLRTKEYKKPHTFCFIS